MGLDHMYTILIVLHNVKCGRLNQWEGSDNCNVEKVTNELLLVLIWHQHKRIQFEDLGIQWP